jgi:hypothetical protein
MTDYFHEREQFYELIEPFTVHYNEQWKRYYYFNTDSEESVWELPLDI